MRTNNVLKKEYFYINEAAKKSCLKTLHKRMENGENPADIIGIDKIVNGLVPISSIIYYRITGEYADDITFEKYNCVHCGKELWTSVGVYRTYCPKCNYEINGKKVGRPIKSKANFEYKNSKVRDFKYTD